VEPQEFQELLVAARAGDTTAAEVLTHPDGFQSLLGAVRAGDQTAAEVLMQSTILQHALAAVQAGDEAAAEGLVVCLEPQLRAAARRHLYDARARRVADSTDICQTVLIDFLKRLGEDREFHLDTEAQLMGLLVRIARNKICDLVRHEQRQVGGLPDNWDCPDPQSTPGRRAERADLVRAIKSRLTGLELEWFNQRALGRTWEELAEQFNCPASTLRVRLDRAIARVRQELAAQETPHDN
jgi:RNA polymerase sigma factor (sigma-70 family)